MCLCARAHYTAAAAAPHCTQVIFCFFLFFFDISRAQRVCIHSFFFLFLILSERMQRIQHFSLIFDRPHKFYEPGEIIAGHAVLKLNDDEHPLRIHGIELTLFGEARVAWTETESYKSATGKSTLRSLKRTINFTSKRNYLALSENDSENEDYHAHNEDSSYTIRLHGAGYVDGGKEHRWPFKFELPLGLPSSFQGRNGSVRYFIKGIVLDGRQQSQQQNYRTKHFINIIVPEPCGARRNMQPLEYLDEKRSIRFCGICRSKSNSVKIRVTLPRRAYMPLENIEISGKFQNTSRVDIEPRIKLVQVITYKAVRQPTDSLEQQQSVDNNDVAGGELITKTERNKLRQLHCSVIGAKSTTGWKALQVQIPAKVAPTISSAQCDILSVEYVLKIRFKSLLPLLDVDMRCEFPIIIGTIPYNGTIINDPPEAAAAVALSAVTPAMQNLAYDARCDSPAALKMREAEFYGGDGGGDGRQHELSVVSSTARREVPSAPPSYWDLFPTPAVGAGAGGGDDDNYYYYQEGDGGENAVFEAQEQIP